MGAARAALALAAGLGAGYMGAQRQEELDDERKADQQMRQEEHDARMAQFKRANDDRIALANASKPVTVDKGATVDFGDGQQHLYDNQDVAASDVRQARALASGSMPGQMQDSQPAPSLADAGGGAAPAPDPSQVALANTSMKPTPVVGGKAFSDQASATAAAAAQNTPEARDARVAQALRERGNPVGAMQYESSSMDMADKVWKRGLRNAIDGGHEGLADFVTKSEAGVLGQHKLQAVPSADGKTVTYNKVNDDGSLTPLPNLTFSNDQNGVIRAAYMLDRAVDPETRYKNMVAEDQKTAQADAKERELTLRQRELEEVKIPNAETRSELADVKRQLAEVQAGRGNGQITREERLRYTTLFTDAGRRMRDTQQTINQVQRDPIFMNRVRKDPNSPEAQQLKSLNEDLAQHKQEREMYRGMLVNSQATPAPAASPAASPAPASAPAPAPASSTRVSASEQASRDTDATKILQQELTKTQQQLGATTDPAQRARLQGDIESLQRELKGKGVVTLANARQPAAAAKPGTSRANPVKVSTAAERNALAKGTFYTAPDGNVYVKQ